jgi:hypothetical protein
MRRLVGENFEGERVKRIAGKDGGRFVEGAVHGGLAAARSSSSIDGRSSWISE